MSATRKTGPRVLRPMASTGPRVAVAQPSTPPTNVHLGNDRLLVGAREVDIAQLTLDPDQPRKHMHPERLAELARSIVAHGVLHPLVVRQEGLGRDGDMRYVIVAGGRRYAAVRLAIAGAPDEELRRRLARVPVVITDTAAADHRVLQLIENLQREDLDPVEEAHALKDLMRIEKLTTDGVASRVQRSQGYVDERLRLLRYEDVEEAVETGVLTKSAAAAIASIRLTEARHVWLERARLGETIRAREVYASKLDRRAPRRPRGDALPNFGNPTEEPAEDRSVGEATAPAALSGSPAADGAGESQPAAVAIPPAVRGASETEPPGSASWPKTSAASPNDLEPGSRQVLDRLAALRVSLPQDIVTLVTESPQGWEAILRSLAEGLGAGERAYGERLLVLGALKGLSCEELLTVLKAEDHPGGN